VSQAVLDKITGALTLRGVELVPTDIPTIARDGQRVPTTDILPSVPQALRLLGGSSGVEWFEIAFIKGLSQRT
jgi:hypothetical protein